MIHAKSCTSTFGLEDVSSQHTTVKVQRSEVTPVLGQTDMLEGKQVWTTQIKIMAVVEHLLQATVEIQLSEPGEIHVLVQQEDCHSAEVCYGLDRGMGCAQEPLLRLSRRCS